LEDFVMGTDADVSEVLLRVDLACVRNCLREDVMHRSQREGIVENILQQFRDAAQGTVADEGEAEDQLSEPGLRYG
jgi:hypothetical protein